MCGCFISPCVKTRHVILIYSKLVQKDLPPFEYLLIFGEPPCSPKFGDRAGRRIFFKRNNPMELTTHKLRISQSTVNTILSRAQGHYKSILLSAGTDEMIFKTKNLECPWCAGVDRFSYTDKFGKGDSFCRHCGYHGGVDLLMKIKNFGYVDALRFMARYLNLPIHEEKTYRVTKTREQPSPVEEVWAASHALGEKDSAYAYLRSRGLKKCFPAALRASNRLRYAQLSEDGRSWDHSFYEGLVAEIVNSEGHTESVFTELIWIRAERLSLRR